MNVLAIELNDAFADAHYNLAQTLCFTTPPDKPRARDLYRKALKLGAKGQETHDRGQGFLIS